MSPKKSSSLRRTELATHAGFGLCALVVIAIGLLAWLKSEEIPQGSEYVGSQSCAGCHPKVYAEWEVSQHQKMMRPDTPEAVVADFATPHADRRFQREDVVWVIGGKWEQQFLGGSPHGDELLPGAWMNLSKTWDFRGWDGWQVPVPKRRCHGCHTVGLDTESGEFLEPNIGCESCHGPSSWHVETWGFGRVQSVADADVCGQCHIRGKDPTGAFFFPTDYQPGEKLGDHFVPLEPYPGENSSNWWGNGRERERHQEYTAWRQGGHADALKSLREGYDGRFGPADDGCLTCHSADAILQPWRDVRLETAENGVTCSVCHNTHGRLDQPRMDCGTCHGEGAFYHTPERNRSHVACPETADVSCADCHMPLTAKIGGAFALHSHHPGIVSPREAAKWQMPSSCQSGGCHLGVSPEFFDPHILDTADTMAVHLERGATR